MSEDDKYDAGANKYLTPSKEEQTLLVLQGKCPHNQGWTNVGHSHNSYAYECRLCRTTKFY